MLETCLWLRRFCRHILQDVRRRQKRATVEQFDNFLGLLHGGIQLDMTHGRARGSL